MEYKYINIYAYIQKAYFPFFFFARNNIFWSGIKIIYIISKNILQKSYVSLKM